MHELVHLNAAGAALPLPDAHSAVVAHMQEETRRGPHWAAEAAADRLAAARTTAARLLGVPGVGHVAFGESATRLWAGALGALPLRTNARLLIARCEWGGNVINALKRARAGGARVEVIPSDRAGRVDVAALRGMMDERVAVIGLPAVSSGLGVAQPVAAVGRLPRPDGCLFFVDAAQILGRAPFDMAACGADVAVAPARKWLRGPRGQAVMALSAKALTLLRDPPLLDQAGSPWTAADAWTTRDDAARFEAYEFSVAGRLGFGAALAAAEADLPMIAARIASAIGRLREGLAGRPGLTIFEDAAEDAGFLTFVQAGETPSATVARLRHATIAIATVGLGYARLDLEARGLTAVCRLAPHAYTTDHQIMRFLAAL